MDFFSSPKCEVAEVNASGVGSDDYRLCGHNCGFLRSHFFVLFSLAESPSLGRAVAGSFPPGSDEEKSRPTDFGMPMFDLPEAAARMARRCFSETGGISVILLR